MFLPFCRLFTSEWQLKKSMLNNEVLEKLDEFIRKFYKVLLLKGLFLTIILLVLFYLLLALFEYFEYSSIAVRTILFYSYILLALVAVVLLVIRPLVKMLRIGKRMDYYQAARIIGDYFPEVEDKLLNLLQLKEQSKTIESELLLASIEQRTQKLSPIPFNLAIDKSKLKKAAVVAISLITVLFFVAMIFPHFLKDTTFRYVNHTTYFEKPAPFVYELQTKSLNVLQHEDLDIVVKTKGEALPNEVDIKINGQSFKMKKENKSTFSYRVKQINKSCSFSFFGGGVSSKPYTINVNPKPVLISLEAKIIYPDYTKLPTESLAGINQINVPKGSNIVWTAQTKDVKSLIINTNTQTIDLKPDKKGKVVYNQRAMQDALITIKTLNEYTSYSDSLQIQLSVINDMYPQIAAIEHKDTLLPQRILFRGQIKDDYGFSNLSFIVKKQEGDKSILLHKTDLEFSETGNVQEFYHFCDIADLNLDKGDKIEYYFEVWDNDAVSGNKSAKSTIFTLKLPSMEELEEKREENSEQLKAESENLLTEIKKLQKQIDEMSRKLIEKKELSWQDKKQLADLAEKHKELEKQIEQLKERFQENNKLDEVLADQNQESFEQNQEIFEQMQELERLMEEVLDKDMKELLQELEKLTQNNVNKDKLNEALQNIKMNNQDISKQLDRNIEMYKHLEVEKKTNELIDKLNELSKQQKDLAEKSKEDSKESKAEKQQQLQEEFRKQQEKLSQIQKQMQELGEKNPLKRDAERENQIEQLQKEAKENLDNNKEKQAAKSMRKAAEQMQQMADDLQQQMDSNEQEQLAEDIEQVRAMLKNLVRLSMQQEELINKTKTTKVSENEYQNIIRKQNTIKEDMKMINDSLFAMSKRQPQVGNMINQELSKIDSYLEKSIESILRYNQVHYSNYTNNTAASSQQYAMTSMNNLALMLSESIENMQKQQQQNNSKSKQNSQCNNPSQSNKPSSKKSMSELQKELNQELERLQKELERQKNKGQQKIGEGAKLNEQLAKAAAQQEMIRKMVQNAAAEAKKKGAGRHDKKLEEIQRQMEQTEKEIVNKTISRQTINRQSKILTRMLEAEKAEKKQGQDFDRKSKTGNNQKNETDGAFLEFQKLKKKETELFKQIPPVYSPFYKKKVDDYFYGTKVK